MRRTKPLTKDAAERVLDGEPTTLPAVAQLLSAAAPAEPEAGTTLPGEAQALAAFRNAQAATPARPGRLPAARAAVIAALSTKLALGIGAVAVAATGTVAVTSSGILPDAPPTPRPSASVPAASSSPPPSVALTNLCAAFETAAERMGSPAEAARRPAFVDLVAAAGGAERVADYCSDLPSPGHPTGKPSDLPTPGPATPSRKPSELPTPGPATPSKKPSELPTPGPATPSKKPTERPTPGPATPDLPIDQPAPDVPAPAGNRGAE